MGRPGAPGSCGQRGGLQKRGLPREGDPGVAGARRQETLGGSAGCEPPVPGRAVPGSPGAAAVVEAVEPPGIGSPLPAGHICGAEPALCSPGLAGGSRPGGSQRHQRAG